MINLIPIEFKNQRVMTTRVLAEQYGTEEKNIQMNFFNNQKRFIEGKHYYKLEGKFLKEFKNSLPNDIREPFKFTSQLILWTDRGVARHAKILDTDEAWEIYEKLEETYFRIKEQKQLSPIEQLRLQYQVIEEHDKELIGIKKKVDSLENNMPLFNVECKELQGVVRKVATKVLGGYKSPAYNDNSLRGRVYADIQYQLRREFGVERYEAIKRCQLETAKKIIEEYIVPFVLEVEIIATNSQLSIDEVAAGKEI